MKFSCKHLDNLFQKFRVSNFRCCVWVTCDDISQNSKMGNSQDTAYWWADVPEPELPWKLKFQPSKHLGTWLSKQTPEYFDNFFFFFMTEAYVYPGPRTSVKETVNTISFFILFLYPKNFNSFSKLEYAIQQNFLPWRSWSCPRCPKHVCPRHMWYLSTQYVTGIITEMIFFFILFNFNKFKSHVWQVATILDNAGRK